MSASEDLLRETAGNKFATILADPPWQFQNRTGKMAPEHKRLQLYSTMPLQDIKALPVANIAEDTAHFLNILWEEIIDFQVMCLTGEANGVGIPDLIIAQNVRQHSCKVYSLDRHFRLMNQVLKVSLYA